MGIGAGLKWDSNIHETFVTLPDMPFILHECKLPHYVIINNKSCYFNAN